MSRTHVHPPDPDRLAPGSGIRVMDRRWEEARRLARPRTLVILLSVALLLLVAPSLVSVRGPWPLEHRPPDRAGAGSSTGGRRVDRRQPSAGEPAGGTGHRPAGSDPLTGLGRWVGDHPLAGGACRGSSVRNVSRGTSAWAGSSSGAIRDCRARARSRRSSGSPCRRWRTACRRRRPGHAGR